ncbi:hypothetical protein BGW37DRAFT_474702 [Umbelopsis sp. PMI_123]|nr:hypothetical protein BGW37DRAFT_474702 [Umbelopsis sp. PMI_123]
MNEGISIIVAVFVILIAMRWLLGAPQPSGSQSQRPNRPRHRVTPEMVETVRAMFPNIPSSAIVNSLQTTGSVEITIEHALRDGTLPMPANITPPRSPPAVGSNNRNTSGQSSSTSSAVTQSNLLQRYNLESKLASDHGPEPPKVWETDAQRRQEMLRKRKEHMILQARKKMLESQQKEQQTTVAEISNNVSATTPAEVEEHITAESFDEMSVDELNALHPSERRRNMMEALERRKTKAVQ